MKEYQVDVYNVNNELVYEEKNMTCNDEQFETFIKLLNNIIVKIIIIAINSFILFTNFLSVLIL